MERGGERGAERAGQRRGAPLLAAVLSIAGSPTAARACAVCFGGRESDWPGAFAAGTLLMLGLPPAILIGAGIAIYRATKRQEARRAAPLRALTAPDERRQPVALRTETAPRRPGA